MRKIIPIAPATPAAGCDDEDGTVPKLDLPLTRRELLKGTGVLMGTLATGGAVSALAPSRAWAVELKALDTAQGTTLMKMARVLYPHRKLPDAAYALVAKDLDADAAKDPKAAQTMRDGIAALDAACGGSFADAPAGRQLDAVKAMEGKPFFNAVRGKCVTSLYDNDIAYVTFGYPGAAWDKGGYLTRGFQDLKWLPNPPRSASPRPFMG